MDNKQLSFARATYLANQASKSGNDEDLLAATIAAVRIAGAYMLDRFDENVQTPENLEDLVLSIHTNDDASLSIVRPMLEQARPGAGWVDDELEGGPLPDGEWWIFDAVEGNVNHVHGLTEWGISATLVRNNIPVLTAVYEPVIDYLYTAVRGSGAAYLNGVPMRPSTKTELRAAIVTTGQAKPGETQETYRQIGASVTAMLNNALVVRMTVPATFQLGFVAAGRTDCFWQFSDVRSGLAAGALLVAEAGGIVTDTRGQPWSLTSKDFLASAPGVHGEAVKALAQAR
jgi:myo-inositol-1(or 4)-monophosphatase